MSNVQVFIDDAQLPTDTFVGTQWVHETDQEDAYGASLTICHADTSSSTGFTLPPTFTAFFAGTEAFMYGTLTKGVAATYTIDFGQARPVVFSSSPVGKSGVELWRLTGLASGYHTLSITPTAGDLTIDYFAYTPTSLTLLSGNNLIFDDQHPAVKYSKGWVSTTDEQYPQGVPFLGTTTGTSTAGSSMQVNFNGDGVAVYGALQQVPGILSISFSVDGASPTIYTPWNGTQTNTSEWIVSFQMFQQELTAGAHTLEVSLKEATGSQMLWLDSVLTGATALTTLANAVGGAGASTGATTTGLGGVGTGVGSGSTAVPTFGTTTPTFNPTSSKSRLSGGAIGGIAGGSSVFVALAVVFLRIFLRWRRNQKPTPPPMEQIPSSATVPVFTPPAPMPDSPTPSSPSPSTGSPSLHAALAQAFGHPPPGGQTPPQQEHTHWDVPDDMSRPNQPSQHGSTSNLRNQWNHGGQV